MASSETTLEALNAARTLLFQVAERTYGCDIESVREIIPYRRATRLPGAPAYVQGLVNLRGTIVTVLDLGVRLDPSRPPVREGSIILAQHGTRNVGIAVDEVMDVQAISEESVDAGSGGAAAGGVGGGAVGGGGGADTKGGLVRGLGHLGDDVVVLIDIHTLVTQVLL